MSLSSILFAVSGLMLIAGIFLIALSAWLFEDSDVGETQDTFGMDTPEDKGHWILLWSGAVLFGFGIMVCLIGGVTYLLEKL